MINMRWLWSSLAIIALLSTFLFIGGFLYASNQILYPELQASNTSSQPTPTPTPKAQEKDGIHILALGDSLTAGTGDMSGIGYVGHVKQQLEEQTGQPVFILNNLAIPGSRTTDWLKQLSVKYTQQAIAEADLILLSIGGNDLFQGGLGILDEKNPEAFNTQPLIDRSPEALKNVKKILNDIHAYNPQATVVYIGLYNPFLNIDKQKTASPVIQAWNDEVFRELTTYDQMYLVPTIDLFDRGQDRFLAQDHFHPNGDGYERIATRIVQILK